MKKRLEAELISIAHRVLKLKNKSEINQLYHETQKLYEALTVLKFYGDYYEQIKQDVPADDLEEKIAAFFEDKTVVETPKAVEVETPKIMVEEAPIEEEILAVEEATAKEEKIDAIENEEETPEEPVIVGEITLEEDEIEEEPIAKLKSDLDFEPIFELATESPIEDVVEEKVQTTIETPKKETKQISFEDLLGENYTEPVFVKPNDVVVPDSLKNVIDEKPLSLNDQHLKTINIGLNDKMAFVKNLFGDSNEDYNRVLSQLNTFSNFDEAKDFIDEIIKPDYNNWDGVDDYAERFIEIVAKKFS
ncbi:MAG: hypothetical protein WCJ62_12855 [Flavobacterium sp.]